MEVSVNILILLKVLLLNKFIKGKPNNMDNSMDEIDQDGYGIKWVYFPDAHGNKHYVDLTAPLLIPRIYAVDVEFRLYTKCNMKQYVKLNADGSSDESSIATDLQKSPIKILTHGWVASTVQLENIKDMYLKHNDVVVIIVDWSKMSEDLNYITVASNTKLIGEIVGKFLNALHENYNVTGDRVHLIGHSLGAHVMGTAGATTTLSIERITGLDPARPLFEFPKFLDSLTSRDAKFVDVIHTSGGILGYESDLGTADFYPNSGKIPQPGCNSIKTLLPSCSHSMARDFFAESIKNKTAFRSYRCSDWLQYVWAVDRCNPTPVYMGEWVAPSARGSYFLATTI